MASNPNICEIDPDLKRNAGAFRRKEKNSAAMIMKVIPEKDLVVLDEIHEDISVDDLREKLPEHLPSFVAYSYAYKHDDGRVSNSLCFVFISPQDVKPELHMMYAGTKEKLVKELGFTKVFELRSLEEFTEQWLKSKLANTYLG